MTYTIVYIFSYLSLLWERAWDRLWATLSLVLTFAALALFGIPQQFGSIGILSFLACLIVAFTGVFLRTGTPFRLPTREDTERHIERASALKHRPLQALQDTPAAASDETISLWRQHLQNAARYIERLRIYTPSPDVSRRDTWGVRHAAILIFVVSLIAAQENARPRLEQAFMPDLAAMINADTRAVDLWITPPEYTQLPPTFLATTGKGTVTHDKSISVPIGSVLKLRAAGFRFTPKLTYNEQQHAVVQPSPQNFTYEMPLQQSGTLKMSSLFSSLGQWDITINPDMPPAIIITKAEATPRYLTRLTLDAQDDHGITKMKGRVILAADDAARMSGKFIEFDIPASHQSSHAEDLTASIMAGQQVLITVEAEDFVGHKTTSAPYPFTLPERVFTNPVAKNLAENRKALFGKPENAVRGAIANNLANILNRPALYKGNYTTFLALIVAAERLLYEPDAFAIESVQDILWNVALKLEDGGMSTAQRDLQEALEKLSSAANDKNMTKEQLQEVVDDVQKKLKQYLQTLASEMQQRVQQGKNMPVISPEVAQKFMKHIDLGKLLDQLRQMSQANSRDHLQKMAQNLKNMVDNLDINKFDQMQEQQMKAMESLQNLQDTIERQQALFDKTNKAQSGEKTQDHAKEQSTIRKQLTDALAKLSGAVEKIPDNLTNADQSMGQSAEALVKDQAEASLPHQKTALDDLQKGMDQAVEQMAQAMQQSLLSFGGGMPGGGGFGDGNDPLGRDVTGGDAKIPAEKERRRVQQIIEELRQRSNEPNRTKVEREYIDRLLQP